MQASCTLSAAALTPRLMAASCLPAYCCQRPDQLTRSIGDHNRARMRPQSELAVLANSCRLPQRELPKHLHTSRPHAGHLHLACRCTGFGRSGCRGSHIVSCSKLEFSCLSDVCLQPGKSSLH